MIHFWKLSVNTGCVATRVVVARHMLHHRGEERRSVLVGSSVHNQRIESYGKILTDVLRQLFIDYFITLNVTTSLMSITYLPSITKNK